MKYRKKKTNQRQKYRTNGKTTRRKRKANKQMKGKNTISRPRVR